MKKKASKSEIAAKVKAADEGILLRSALEKVKAGKPLNSAERKAVERAEKSSNLIMAASLSAAAAMLETHVSVLKRAKKAGAPGFRANGSVCISELKPWLAENLDSLNNNESKEALECRRLLAQCEKLEFQNEVERGKYTHNDSIREQGARIGAATRSELLRFKADVPTWEGLSAAEMERRVDRLIDSICKNLSDQLSKVYRR